MRLHVVAFVGSDVKDDHHRVGVLHHRVNHTCGHHVCVRKRAKTLRRTPQLTP